MPHPRRVILLVVDVALRPVPRQSRASAAEDFAFFHENVMGTSLELRVLADDLEAARAAESRVLDEIDRLVAIFSGYDPSSEFSRWQAAPRRPVPLSPELFEVLQACDRWRERSGGAFDPRVEALSRLWAQAARRDRLPTSAELELALRRHGPARLAARPRPLGRRNASPTAR